ncbi:MAG: DUF86 domain-containing protein [Archaeoglobaceae archaeon]
MVEAFDQVTAQTEHPIEISGTFYNLHTSIEAAMVIAAILVKDLGKKVEDDYHNIETLTDLGVIDSDLADSLKMCNGLRNCSHRYNGVDTTLVLESIDEVRDTLFTFIERVESVLDELGSD